MRRNALPLLSLLSGALLCAAASAATTCPTDTMGARVGELRFADTPIKQVIADLRRVTGATIIPNWRDLEPADVTPDTPITADVSGMTLAQSLSAVAAALRPCYVEFQCDDNVVLCATREHLDRMVVRVYPVDDLLKQYITFHEARSPDRERVSHDAAADALLRLIVELVDPGCDEVPGAIHEFAGRLVIRVRLSDHRQIESLLAKLREKGPP